MVSFSICLLALVVGYFVYGRVVERIFGPDPGRKTPALERPDGVDYVVLPRWKIFMIQFLNIAGLGPIFGAILGAKFGVSSYLWIVLGTIFAGAVHDYTAGMLSLRYGGKSLPELIGMCLGKYAKQLMVVFTVVLMVLVGAVFVDGPAQLLARLTPEHLDATFWIVVVFAYYLLANPCAHRQDHRTDLPGVRSRLAVYGGRDHGDVVRSPSGLARVVGRDAQPPTGRLAHLPHHVHLDRLRSDLRVPCHPIPDDGPLHDQRASGAPHLLRGHGVRRHRGAHLGGCSDVFLPPGRFCGVQCGRGRQ